MIIYKSNTGKLKKWVPQGSPEKLPLFEGIRDTLLDAYVQHLALVKDATGFTDEGAIQAISYTLWRGSWDLVDRVPKGELLNFNRPEQSLMLFGDFLDAEPDSVKRTYVELVVAYADDETLDYGDVMDILGSRITYGAKGFMGANDYKVLADAVVLIHQMNSKKKVPAKDTKELERLTALAIGVIEEADF